MVPVESLSFVVHDEEVPMCAGNGVVVERREALPRCCAATLKFVVSELPRRLRQFNGRPVAICSRTSSETLFHTFPSQDCKRKAM